MKTHLLLSILIIFSLCGFASAAGLVSHWKFDEGSGTVAHDSAGTNNGTISGATWTAGQIGGALSFDGVDDYVNCGNGATLDGMNAITLSVWVNVRQWATIDEARIISKRTSSASSYEMCINRVTGYPAPVAAFYTTAGGYGIQAPGNLVGLNDWYYLVATYSGSQRKFYINGIEVSSANGIAGAVRDTNVDLWIGRMTTGIGKTAFNGLIDDVRIYDCALDANQVAGLYAYGTLIPQSIKIVGPNSVPEQSDTQYHVIGHYANGLTADITSDANFTVVPDEFAMIDANGLLMTDRLYRQKELCTIYADYKGFIAQKQISIFPVCNGNECTGPQLLKRNIADVIEIKQGAINDIEYARKMELASFQLLGKIAANPQYKSWGKARLQILAAWTYENWACRKIDETIDLLEIADGIMQ